MKKEFVIGIVLLTLIVGALVGYYFGYDVGFEKAIKGSITSFDECVAAGFPVAESYPSQCRTDAGETFTQDIGNEIELSDLIVVENPRPNQWIGSPVLVEGQARGFWYFEASFPIELVGDNGKFLGEGIAQAQADWMTEEFVPFSLELSFIKPSSQRGNLILRNDNPSGLPENIKELRIPIRFEE